MKLFLDTEFTDFNKPELISVAFVSEDGQHEFYRENTSHAPYRRSQFVKEVVIPLLDGGKVAKTEDWIAHDLRDWFKMLPEGDITVITDYVGDMTLVSGLLRLAPIERPLKWVFNNFAFREELKKHGLTAETVNDDKWLNACAVYEFADEEFFKQDPRQHHALVDARAMRYSWNKGLESLNEQDK